MAFRYRGGLAKRQVTKLDMGLLFQDFQESFSSEKQVECLGLKFDSEEARRAYFLDRLREGLEELEII